MSLVRRATKDDIDWIVDIAISDMAKLYKDPTSYDPDYLKVGFLPFLLEKGVVLVIDDYAVIAGIITPHLYNPSLILATECVWWVREDKRNGSSGMKLLFSFEDEAKRVGADRVVLSLMPSSTVSSLNKRGYIEKEYSYSKEI